MTSVFSWQNSNQPLLCFVLYSKAKFACYSRYLLTSYFCIPVPYNEKDSFFGYSRRSCMSSQNRLTSASSALLVGAQTWITLILDGLPWKRTEIILSFLRLHPRTAFRTLLLTMRATPFVLNGGLLHLYKWRATPFVLWILANQIRSDQSLSCVRLFATP